MLTSAASKFPPYVVRPFGVVVLRPGSARTFFGGRRIVGALVSGVPDTQALRDHCGRHSIVSDIELIAPEQINAAYERTLKGDVEYRFVFDCTRI